MCNSLHISSSKIKKEGTGYKIFTSLNNKLYKLVSPNYRKPYGKRWTKWNPNIGIGDGFCFFLSKKESKRCLKNWIKGTSYIKTKKYKIYKIIYKEGLGKHIESNITTGHYMIALCKEFKIVEEIE